MKRNSYQGNIETGEKLLGKTVIRETLKQERRWNETATWYPMLPCIPQQPFMVVIKANLYIKHEYRKFTSTRVYTKKKCVGNYRKYFLKKLIFFLKHNAYAFNSNFWFVCVSIINLVATLNILNIWTGIVYWM